MKEKRIRKRRPLAIWYMPAGDPKREAVEGFNEFSGGMLYVPAEPVTSPALLRNMWLGLVTETDLTGRAQIVTLGDPLPKIVRREVVEFADEKPLAKSPKGE